MLDSFHTEIEGPVFLSVGPEAKLDMFKNFDLDKLFDLHLDLPSAKDPEQTNNDTTTSSAAAAASNFIPEIQPDSVQPGEIRLHSWMLCTSQAPVLDIRGQSIMSTLDLRDAFHQLCLCPTEDETQSEWSTNGRRKSQKTKKPH